MKKNKLEMSMLEAIEVKMGKTNELWTVKRWNKYKDGQFLNISVNEMGVSGDHFWSEHWLLMYADLKKKSKLYPFNLCNFLNILHVFKVHLEV